MTMLLPYLASLLLFAGAADFEAQTLDGQTAVGRLAKIDGQQVVLETSSGPSEFALSKLATLTRKRGDAAAAGGKPTLWLELVDETSLGATDFSVQAETARVTLTGGHQMEIPTRHIRWVRFTAGPDRDPKLTKQWSEITETKATGDLLVIRKNAALDYVEGVLKDADAETFQFELDGEAVKVKRAKVEGIVFFHPAPANLAEPIGRLSTEDGSRLAVKSCALMDQTLSVTTPAGVTIGVLLDDLAKFDLSSGNVAFLSDLEPASTSYVPFLGWKEEPKSLAEFYKFRRDIGYEQNPLKLDGKVYRKGLSLVSRTALAYKLPGKFRQFRAMIGIDDSVRETGSVNVEIRGDGKSLWQGEVRGSDPVRELELEIAGVKRLEILVDYGSGLDIGDRLDLCDARVTK